MNRTYLDLGSLLSLCSLALPGCAVAAPLFEPDQAPATVDVGSPAPPEASADPAVTDSAASAPTADATSASESNAGGVGAPTTGTANASSSGSDSPSMAGPVTPRSTSETTALTAIAPSANTNGSLAVTHPTLYTSGRQLFDTCGQPFVTRGVEQIFGDQLPEGNDWVGLLEQISNTRVNAVRILIGTALGTEDVDALLDAVSDHGMVAYISPEGTKEAAAWLGQDDVRTMLQKHEQNILIDAFGEPTFDDRDRFLSESTAAVKQLRSWGYRVPLTVTANQYGRDLPSILDLGAQIVAADPLQNTVLGWQAYWADNGYYQGLYGYSLPEAVQAVATAPFPIQLGLDRVTDYPATATADYGTLLSATEQSGIGWLWWDWYNPYGNENDLSMDGSAAALTATGQSVIAEHAASVSNTARRACTRAQP